MHVQDCMSKSASATGYNKRSMYCLHMEIVSRDTRGSHLYIYRLRKFNARCIGSSNYNDVTLLGNHVHLFHLTCAGGKELLPRGWNKAIRRQ